MKKRPDSLKRKNISNSAKAAVSSAVFHVVLILLAGSIVAVHYVKKLNAEFTVSDSPPKLERRQLQMPAKLERVRQTSRRPKIVSRQVSAASPQFTAPDMGKMGDTSTQKFTMPFSRSGRDFSALSKGFGTGAPQIKFFRIRAQGEKFIFIVDGSEKMLADETGGLKACDYVKQQVLETVGKMPASVLFNVIFYDGETVDMFRPRMIPVTADAKTALNEWITPFISDPADPGLKEDQNTYVPEEKYETAMGNDASGWLRALQSAFEQRPDNIFIVGPDWGRHSISRDKGQRLLDFSLWELLGGSGAFSISGSEALRDDRKLRDDLIKQAVDAIKDEEKERELAEDPEQFLHDLLDYIQYSEVQILDHADAVCRMQYGPYQLPNPRVHVVRLVSEEDFLIGDEDTTYFRDLVRTYDGEIKFFQGSKTFDLEKATADDTAVPSGDSSEQAAAEIPESNFHFFGAKTEGTRVAFLLDASGGMLEEDTGGTNSYGFIKSQLVKTVEVMDPETKFNVILYDRDRTALYRPEMSTVSENSAGLADWLAEFDIDSAQPGLAPDRKDYSPQRIYETALASDVQGLPLAVQAAMEQDADAILVVSTGIGKLPVEREKARRLLNFAICNALGATAGSGGSSGAGTSISSGTQEEITEETDEEGNITQSTTTTDDGSTASGGSGGSSGSSSGGLLRPLANDRKQRAAIIRQALTRIADENKKREDAELPLGFVHDIFDYIEYTPDMAYEHIETVGKFCYAVDGEDEPKLPEMHFICMLPGNEKPDRLVVRDIRGLLSSLGGDLKFFHGAESDDKIRKLNRLIDLQP